MRVAIYQRDRIPDALAIMENAAKAEMAARISWSITRRRRRRQHISTLTGGQQHQTAQQNDSHRGLQDSARDDQRVAAFGMSLHQHFQTEHGLQGLGPQYFGRGTQRMRPALFQQHAAAHLHSHQRKVRLCLKVPVPLPQQPSDTVPLLIDESRFQASYQGHSLELTPAEFRLLKILATQPGHVFSREQLLNNLYDDYRVVTDRTIDSHIKSLRAKLRQAEVITFGIVKPCDFGA